MTGRFSAMPTTGHCSPHLQAMLAKDALRVNLSGMPRNDCEWGPLPGLNRVSGIEESASANPFTWTSAGTLRRDLRHSGNDAASNRTGQPQLGVRVPSCDRRRLEIR